MAYLIKAIVVRSCVCPCSVLQDACATLWSETGRNEMVDHYEVKCKDVQPFDGYEVIKLEIASRTSVSVN